VGNHLLPLAWKQTREIIEPHFFTKQAGDGEDDGKENVGLVGPRSEQKKMEEGKSKKKKTTNL